jgi:hypothetical protein
VGSLQELGVYRNTKGQELPAVSDVYRKGLGGREREVTGVVQGKIPYTIELRKA